MKFTKSFKLMFVFIITFALYLVSYIAINKAEAKPTEEAKAEAAEDQKEQKKIAAEDNSDDKK